MLRTAFKWAELAFYLFIFLLLVHMISLSGISSPATTGYWTQVCRTEICLSRYDSTDGDGLGSCSFEPTPLSWISTFNIFTETPGVWDGALFFFLIVWASCGQTWGEFTETWTSRKNDSCHNLFLLMTNLSNCRIKKTKWFGNYLATRYQNDELQDCFFSVFKSADGSSSYSKPASAFRLVFLWSKWWITVLFSWVNVNLCNFFMWTDDSSTCTLRQCWTLWLIFPLRLWFTPCSAHITSSCGILQRFQMALPWR